jgi:hypothetical protein
MHKNVYTIIKNGIEQENTFQQVIDELKKNMILGAGYLGDYLSHEHGQLQSYFITFSLALAALFEKADKEGWSKLSEDSWRDEKITGKEKITVDYKNDMGWAITNGHSDNGIHLELQQVTDPGMNWDINWSSEIHDKNAS